MYGFCDGNARRAVEELPGFLIVECQIGECSATCSAVSDKLVLVLKQSGEENKEDAVPKWRMTRCKWRSAVLVLAPEELPIDLALPKQQCGQPCMASVCIQNVQALQPNGHFALEKFCDRLLSNQVPCTKMLFTDEAFFLKDGVTHTHTQNLRVWLLQKENPVSR
jgi:hypothetical protein